MLPIGIWKYKLGAVRSPPVGKLPDSHHDAENALEFN